MRSIYLDTANWIELAEGRCKSNRYEELVLARQITPVLSFIHLLEFVNIGPKVIEYVENLRLRADFLWTKNLHAVIAAEAQAEYERIMGLPGIPPKVFGTSLLDCLQYQFDWEDRADLKNGSIPYAVKILGATRTYTERFLKFRANMPFDQRRLRASRVTRPRFDRSEKARWIMADIPRHLRTQSGFEYEPEITADLLMSLDLSRCPASEFRFAFFEGEFMSTQSKGSDFEDLYHLVGPAYCDMSFVDAATYEKLRKGKATPMPRKMGNSVIG